MRSALELRDVIRFCAALALAACPFAAQAQGPASPPPADPPTVITAPPDAPAQSAPSGSTLPRLPTPGETLGAIGRFLDQSISGVGAGVKGAGDAVGGATGAAGEIAKGVGDAAGTIARLPLSSTVSGWERCPLAPNGAPDCEVASVALCKTKGFTAGKSIDITASQKCPASVWLEKRQPAAGECTDEAFVSKAICQ